MDDAQSEQRSTDDRPCCGLKPQIWLALLFATTLVTGGLIASRLFAREDTQYKPRRVLDPQPTIVNAPTKLVAEVLKELGPSELVLGITINGQSRAYPINMLTGPKREIINDQLGEQAIAATW